MQITVPSKSDETGDSSYVFLVVKLLKVNNSYAKSNIIDYSNKVLPFPMFWKYSSFGTFLEKQVSTFNAHRRKKALERYADTASRKPNKMRSIMKIRARGSRFTLFGF